MNIAVVGASGFIGGHTTRVLLDSGHQVVGMSRSLPPASRADNRAVYIVGVDLTRPLPFPSVFDGIDTVVHVTGIINEVRPNNTFSAVHVDGMRRLVQCALASKSVRRLVYVSALGASLDSDSAYSRSKAEAEQIALSAGIEIVILRPSLVIGSDGEFVAQMKSLVQHGGLGLPLPFPVIPIPGSGLSVFQPVYALDLARCISSACSLVLMGRSEIIEIGGSTRISFEALVLEISRRLGVRKPLLHIPIKTMLALAPFFELLPNPPITRDQLKNIVKDSICDTTRMNDLLGTTGISLQAMLDKSI